MSKTPITMSYFMQHQTQNLNGKQNLMTNDRMTDWWLGSFHVKGLEMPSLQRGLPPSTSLIKTPQKIYSVEFRFSWNLLTDMTDVIFIYFFKNPSHAQVCENHERLCFFFNKCNIVCNYLELNSILTLFEAEIEVHCQKINLLIENSL
jgi:hypothetical protein